MNDTTQNDASEFDILLRRASRVSLVVLAVIAAIVALRLGRYVLAPLFLAVLVGLMFTPVALRLERLGVRQAFSAILIVVLFIAMWIAAIAILADPVSVWINRFPLIWRRLQLHLRDWQGMIDSFGDIRERVQSIAGSGGSIVVEDGSTIENVAYLAPSILSQIVVFLVALYFFLMTRNSIRESALRLCLTFRARLRAGRVFRDVQARIGRYLLTISIINAGLGCSTALAMWLLGVPSPLLWGSLAFLLNFMIFLGPVTMVLVLLAVGLGTSTTLTGVMLPALVYFGLNTIESQLVTPHMVGRSLTLNPLAVFSTIVFWLWLWGPVGGLIAVPSLMIMQLVYLHIIARPQVRLEHRDPHGLLR